MHWCNGKKEYTNDINFINYNNLITDSPEESTGLITKKDDVYVTGEDFLTIMQENNYNNPEFFTNDTYYIVQEGDTLAKIAKQYDISIETIKEYNGTSTQIMAVGNILRVPSYVQYGNNFIDNYETEYKVGITMESSSKNINWNSVIGVDYIILEITNSNKVVLAKIVEDCINSGYNIGFLFQSTATTIYQLKKEVKDVCSKIEGTNPKYPTYIGLNKNYCNLITIMVK